MMFFSHMDHLPYRVRKPDSPTSTSSLFKPEATGFSSYGHVPSRGPLSFFRAGLDGGDDVGACGTGFFSGNLPHPNDIFESC